MNTWSIVHSKTDDDCIMLNNRILIGCIKWDSNETREEIVNVLNNKEKQIEELTKENEFLKWYSEELEVHLPKELLQQVKEFYEKRVRK